MTGRPRKVDRAALPRCLVPPPPEHYTPDEKRMWMRLARQVELVGTYDEGNETAFEQMVRVCTAAAAVDFLNADTAATKLLTTANSLLGRFGLTPADRSKVPAAPVGNAADEEFGS